MLSSWATSAGGFAAQHTGLAVLITFLAAIVEAVAVLGVIVPGTPILMAVAGTAFVAGSPMLPILAAAVLGAVIGDGVSFWLGQRFGDRIRDVWPFASGPELIGRAEAFFWGYGIPSVAIARFVPIMRSTVPLVAGMAGMPVHRFLAANVVSALIWAPAHVYAAGLATLAIGQFQAGQWPTASAIAAGLLLFAGIAYALHRIGRGEIAREDPGDRG